jgi:histone-lysine N-methyltransferase MLL3
MHCQPIIKRSELLNCAETRHGLMFTLFTAWGDRYKQILKKWRALPSARKAPFLQQARENRAALRMKKTQQVSLDVCVYMYVAVG